MWKLEEPESQFGDGTTFAKQKLGYLRAKNRILLGLFWEKQEDQIEILMPWGNETHPKEQCCVILQGSMIPLVLWRP